MNDGNHNLAAEDIDEVAFVRGPHLVVFFVDWWCSRPWLALIAALPGMLLAGALWMLVVLGGAISADTLGERYQAAGTAALQQGDAEAAHVYYRRLAMIRGADPSVRYGLAIAADLQGDPDRARSMMQGLAPDNAAGYSEAHLWLAKDLLSRPGDLTPEVASVIKHHLQQVLEQPTRNMEAVRLMGVLLWSQGDPAQALPYLEQTATETPEWNLPVAVLHRMRRDPLAARRAAERAARHYEQAVEAQPGQWDLRLRWAQSEVLLQDYSKAARILRAGLDSPNPQRFHDALVDVYLDWYAATDADSPKGISRRLELLNRALEHGPHHPRLLTVFAELSGQQGEQGQMSRRALGEALADGTAPATVHLILGTQALEQGDLERCQMHLELAAQQAPRMPIVLNNLAWVLAHRENPELDRAHALAQRATHLVSRPEFYYTLATILARQGKYLEAIAQFETVLRLAASRTDVYQPLAELYRKLGNFELAELYDDRAQAARENQ
jgi:Tfp pilus assembly protein PilF